MALTKKRSDDEEEYQPTETVEINPRKDILRYEIPLGVRPLEEYKKRAAEQLARKIIDIIEPEFLEQPGYELMRYVLIVKRYEDTKY
jgi:hypothetical protein